MAHVIGRSERQTSSWFWPVLAMLAACDPTADDAEENPAAPAGDANAESSTTAARDTANEGANATGTAAAAPEVTAGTQAIARVDPRGAQTALERARMAHTGETSTPLELRKADRAMMIYADPRHGAGFRGKLTHGETFAVFERVQAEDPECTGDGWARIGTRAFACLEHTSPSKRTPRELPVLAKGQLTPSYYARVRRKNAAGEIPQAPRWASRSALAAGDEPIDFLQPDHDYAFERRRPSRRGTILVDKGFRAVREADVRRLEPSPFAGRDIVAEPLPDEGRLAWSLIWPHAPIRAEPHPDAKVVGKLPLHEDVFVTDETKRSRGTEWVRIGGNTPGWIDGDEIRRWYPAPPPDDLGPEDLWIDVELEQQTLAVMLGDAPIFVTMIASGNHKHPTPQGVYRIKTKMATSTMDSQPGDDEAYSVESVPWAQFFHKRYGLHGTFWHNRFGRRTSHGCVNLSAKDAALVYAMTAPDPLPGWAMAFAHDDVLGTVVRVRKMDQPAPDRRKDKAVADEPVVVAGAE